MTSDTTRHISRYYSSRIITISHGIIWQFFKPCLFDRFLIRLRKFTNNPPYMLITSYNFPPIESIINRSTFKIADNSSYTTMTIYSTIIATTNYTILPGRKPNKSTGKVAFSLYSPLIRTVMYLRIVGNITSKSTDIVIRNKMRKAPVLYTRAFQKENNYIRLFTWSSFFQCCTKS